jgi:hypothetical protein
MDPACAAMNGPQRRLVSCDETTVLAIGGAAVTEIVLGVGEDPRRRPGRRELQTLGHGDAHHAGQLGGLAEGLVGSSPSLVESHRYHR